MVEILCSVSNIKVFVMQDRKGNKSRQDKHIRLANYSRGSKTSINHPALSLSLSLLISYSCKRLCSLLVRFKFKPLPSQQRNKWLRHASIETNNIILFFFFFFIKKYVRRLSSTGSYFCKKTHRFAFHHCITTMADIERRGVRWLSVKPCFLLFFELHMWFSSVVELVQSH